MSNTGQDRIPVSVRMLTPVKAIEILHMFSTKSATNAEYMAVVYHLLKSNGYTIRSKTRVSQAAAASLCELCTQFMHSYVHPFLVTEDQDKIWILNMAQTAMFYHDTTHYIGSKRCKNSKCL